MNNNQTKNIKINKKIFLILTIIISIIILQINIAQAQTQPQTCNNAGGIWCNNNQCITPNDENKKTIDCTITQTQTIDTKTTSSEITNYYMNSLVVNNNVELHFITTEASMADRGERDDSYENCVGGSGGVGVNDAGDGGAGGIHDTSKNDDKGGCGGGGGAGGQLSTRGGGGAKGVDGMRGGAIGGSPGSPPSYAGATIKIFATNNIIINGILSVNGTSGTNGNKGTCGGNTKAGGGGGVGGSGAGAIYFMTNTISGEGQINAIAGDGSNGGAGASKDDCGALAGSGNGGGGGGAGGGGLGGNVYFFTLQENILIDKNKINVLGGQPGTGGVGGNDGKKGEDGTAGNNGTIEFNCLTEPERCISIYPEYNPENLPDDQISLLLKILRCSDGSDNNEDGFTDMDDKTCREVIEWDASIWSMYSPKPPWYDKSSKNGTDLVCGDDPFINENNPQDLGFITPDGAYACFDNSQNFASGNDQNSVYLSGSNYTWRFASNHPGIIMRAFDSMFVSNIDQWYHCDANNYNLFNQDFTLSEYQTVSSAEDYMTPLCSKEIYNSLNYNVVDFDECGGSVTACKKYVEDNYGAIVGYCPLDSYGALKRFNISKVDDFMSQCYDCEIYDGDSFNPIGDLINNDLKVEFCTNNLFNHYEICKDVRVSTDESDSDDMFKDSMFCKSYPQLCLDVSFSTSDSCEFIHKEVFKFNYIGDEYKFCNSNQYCHNGFLTKSSDSGENYCCVGENSYCQDIGELSCAEIGGELYKEENQEICLGISVESEDGDCCFGRVNPSTSLLLGGSMNGDSFICYNYQNKNLIAECCDSLECLNKDNTPLNSDDSDIFSTIYLMSGASYHMLSSFDSYSVGRKVLSASSKNDKEFSIRHDIDGQHLIYPSFRRDFSIVGFDFLEFDFLINNKESLDSIILISNNEEWEFNFPLEIENHKWKRIKIDISSNSPTGFNKEQVSDIKLKFNQNAYFAIDRIFLSTNNNINNINSDNRYCTGNWGTWINNLDGLTNKGFFDNNNNPRSSNIRISEYGPYKEACDSSMSFSWTGSACCGDDSFNNNNEYWIDSQGICWNGVASLHDNTVAYALSNDYNERNELERSLLFFAGEPWICDLDGKFNQENYSDIKFNFGNNIVETIFSEKIKEANVVSQFAIKGNWLCEAGKGWTKLEDVNRVSIMAAFLLQEAQTSVYENEFTIHCSQRDDVVNYVIDATKKDYDDLLGTFCLLRTGKNTDFIEANTGLPKGDIYLVFESKDLELNILDKINDSILLKVFPALNGSNIDCSNVPNNPISEEFFSACDLTVQNFEGSIYHNKPFKLTMITSIDLRSSSFLQRFWDALKGFFSNLFGSNSNNEFFYLKDISEGGDFKEIYISKQNNKLIVGKSEIIGPYQNIRVDYTNLSSNMSYLANIINNKRNEIIATWSPNVYTQTIFTSMNLNNGFVNFNELTSTLRLQGNNPRINFGILQNCTETTTDNVELNMKSGQQDIVYKTNSSINCNVESFKIICFDGELKDDKFNSFDTSSNFYNSCDIILDEVTEVDEYTDDNNNDELNGEEEQISCNDLCSEAGYECGLATFDGEPCNCGAIESICQYCENNILKNRENGSGVIIDTGKDDDDYSKYGVCRDGEPVRCDRIFESDLCPAYEYCVEFYCKLDGGCDGGYCLGDNVRCIFTSGDYNVNCHVLI